VTDTLTQRARDVAGRLHKRPNTELAAMRQREKAAAIISELVGRIEGVWQDIDTAPKDGTEVLLYVPRRLGDLVAMGANKTGTQWWARNLGDLKPTHWMQLPPPPSVLGKQEGEG